MTTKISRILHLIPTLGGGGAERQLAMLACEQQRRGIGVHIGVRRMGGVHQTVLTNSGVKVQSIGDFRGVSPRLVRNMIRLIRELKPTIVQTWLPQMDLAGGIAALVCQKPWVIAERTSAGAFKGLGIRTWLRRKLGGAADAVVANSLGGVEYWRASHPKAQVLSRVPNAVDIGTIQRMSDDGRLAVDPNLGRFFLVVGRLVESKGLPTVVDAISLIARRDNVKLLVIGDGPFEGQLRRQIEAKGLGDVIILRSYETNWWRYLGCATGLVSMSRFEGQPNVVLEAMAAACPLILSDISGHRECFGSDGAIFVPLDDSHALAASMNLILEKPEYAGQLGRRGYESVLSLTTHAMADSYMTVYEDVLRGRR